MGSVPGGEQYQIGGKECVDGDFDDIAHSELRPSDCDPGATVQPFDASMIDLIIRPMAFLERIQMLSLL